MNKRKVTPEIILRIIEAVIAVTLVVILLNSVMRMGKQSSKEGCNQLEASVRRSVMACYADEGVYPPDIKYLEDHYGLQINKAKYIVRYDAVAENLMPDVTVLERKK